MMAFRNICHNNDDQLGSADLWPCHIEIKIKRYKKYDERIDQLVNNRKAICPKGLALNETLIVLRLDKWTEVARKWTEVEKLIQKGC